MHVFIFGNIFSITLYMFDCLNCWDLSKVIVPLRVYFRVECAISHNFLLLLWPELKSYGVARKDICKKVAGNNDFSIYIEFLVNKKENYINEKINILWKLPDIFSISIDPYQYDWENKIHDSHLFFTHMYIWSEPPLNS